MTRHSDDAAGPPADVAELPLDRNQAILQAAKQVGALLKRTGYPFALAGSVAVHAHGGAQNLQHDVDFCILPEDADAVAETLRDAGLAVHTPPEDWLLKADRGGQQVDLIFELAHRPVTHGRSCRPGPRSCRSTRCTCPCWRRPI